MIYVSSSCIKCDNIAKIVSMYVENGIKNIELSGGTQFYENLEDDLLVLKEKFKLNYIVHNYFPPPIEPFILNLASLDDELWTKTVEFIKKSVEFAIRLDSPVYGLHAGFFVNPDLNEIGQQFKKQALFDKESAICRFVKWFNKIKD